MLTGDGRDRRGAGRPPGRGQGRVHRVDRGGQADPAHGRGHRQAADPGTRRQGRERGLRRRAARPGGRGHRQRHLLQPGPRLLRGLPAAGAGVGRGRGAGPAPATGSARCGSATRWTRTPTSARSTRGQQLDKIRELSAAGEAEGAERWSPPCRLPDRGLLVPAHGVHRGQPVAPDRPGGDLRAGAVGAHVPHPGGGGGEGQQHAVRAVRGGLDREGQPDPLDGAAAARRAWSGPTPTTGSTRPARSAATGSPGSGGRAAGTAWPRTSMPDRKPSTSKKTRTPEEGRGGVWGGRPPETSTAWTSARPTSCSSAARSRGRSRAAPTR